MWVEDPNVGGGQYCEYHRIYKAFSDDSGAINALLSHKSQTCLAFGLYHPPETALDESSN